MKLIIKQLTNIRLFIYWFLYLLIFPVLTVWFTNYRGFHGLDIISLIIIVFLFLIYFLIYISLGTIRPFNIGKILMPVICIFIAVFNFIDLFLFINFQSQIRLAYLILIIDTNVSEISGFMSTYVINWKTLILFCCYPGFGIVFNFLKKKFFIYGFVAIVFITPLLFSYGMKLRPEISSSHGVMTMPILVDNALDELIDILYTENDLEIANENISAINNESEALYLLIIGESHSKYHSSLYGYPRPTMPHMEELAKQGKLLVFNDITTPHLFTMYAVPKLISMEAHDNDYKFYETSNIIDIMRSAGFKTWYLSNQTNISELGLTHMAIAARADVFRRTSGVWSMISDNYLFPFLDDAIKDPSPKKFVVLHLIGNHNNYKDTYPEDFSRFPLDEIPEFFNEQQRNNHNMINHYDNSVAYNDYFLKQVIDKINQSNTNSYVLYVSDHGENLYEEKDMIFHMEFMPTIYTAEVPMFIYFSEKFMKKLTLPKIRQLASSVNNPWSSEDLPHLIMDLSQVEYSGFEPAKSIINPAFVPKIRIVSRSGIMYDELKKLSYKERVSGKGLK